MLVEIHMLQTHPPSNPNRDDLGAPKSAMFGGVLRARISSQCIKRSIRQSELFRNRMEGNLGIRTVYFPELVANALRESGIPPKDHAALVQACANIASKEKAEQEDADSGEEGINADDGAVGDTLRPRTGQLIFVGPLEAGEFARILDETRNTDEQTYKEFMAPPSAKEAEEQKAKTKKGAKKATKEKESRGLKNLNERLRGAYQSNAVDIALFGRMVTSDAFENAEAAMQVAHAISTHKITPETDYYTAVDDLKGDLDAGFAYGGVYAQFSSATFYKYFSLNYDALCANLGGNRELAARAVTAFIEAAATTVPTGKRNSYANNNLPDAILVEIKEQNIPTSYANAFAVPVTTTDAGGMIGGSVARLRRFAVKIGATYGINPERLWCSVEDNPQNGGNGGHSENFREFTMPAMLERIGNMLGGMPNDAGA